MNKIIWICAAFLSGAFLPLQAGFNTKLGKAAGSAVHASMISFIVGALAVGLYILLSRQSMSFDGIKTAPAYAWLGGLLGAFYVTVIILAFPKIGPALTFGFVVAGQMTISVLLDHFNILVSQPHTINIYRVAGIGLIILGVILVRKF